MAKKEVTGFVKLQIKGGQANPAPPVGPVSYTHLTLPTSDLV